MNKEERSKRFQEARQITRALLERLELQYKQTVSRNITDIPIFDASEVMEGLGLNVLTNDLAIPFQFVDILKRSVKRFDSRRKLEDHIGALSEEDYKRYEIQDGIKILANEKPVGFGQRINQAYNNPYISSDKKEFYDKGFNEALLGRNTEQFIDERLKAAYNRGVKHAKKAL